MKATLLRLFIVLFLLSFILLGAKCKNTHRVFVARGVAERDVVAEQNKGQACTDTLVRVYEHQDENKSVYTEENSAIDLQQDLSKVRYLEEPISADTTLIVYYNTGFAFAFSPRYKQSIWVAYQYLPSELQKVTKREGAFKQDARVKGTANNGDYARTGYDKGHLAPAGDMAWSVQAMKESFYFTNISPQLAAFNRGIWKELEEQVRRWVERYDTLYIATGPLFLEGSATIGRNSISVPSHFYKALLTRRGGNWQAVGYLMANRASAQLLDSFRYTIDSLEQLSGLDFFPLLPDSVEVKVESEYDKKFWHAK